MAVAGELIAVAVVIIDCGVATAAAAGICG